MIRELGRISVAQRHDAQNSTRILDRVKIRMSDMLNVRDGDNDSAAPITPGN